MIIIIDNKTFSLKTCLNVTHYFNRNIIGFCHSFYYASSKIFVIIIIKMQFLFPYVCIIFERIAVIL